MNATTPLRRTQDELVTELTSRFGSDPYDWAFRCPHCGDVATGRDFAEAKDHTDKTASDRLGQECIGRSLGILRKDRVGLWKGRGCDWAAYGLFRGPDVVVTPEGKEIWCFPIADIQ